MKVKNASVILLVLLTASFFVPQRVHGREATEITDIIIDGDIHENAPAYTRDAGSDDVYCYWNTYYRGFVEWNISSIPDAAVIDRVRVRFRSYSANYDGTMRMYEMVNQPSLQTNDNAGNQVIYDDAADGDVYVITPAGGTNTWFTVTLSAAAVADFNTTADWFAIGTYVGSGGADSFYSSETAYGAILLVDWHLSSDYAFYFDDAVYENGTDAGTVTVTASLVDDSEDFNVSGGDWWYSPTLPTAFSWDIGGGAARYLYVTESENFTVTLPDGTDYSYGFTVKDYTGKAGLGDSYLEAYRTIGGTETLVERMKITQPNPTPLNLVYGKTYHIKILYADGTRYDWGYFLAGADTSNTIIARSTEFTDQAHFIQQTILVEASRSSDGSTITVDYNDIRDSTTWSNVTITRRGGGTVLQATRSNSTYTLNWASANASLGYIVSVGGVHGDYGEWGYVMIFDPSESFPAAPSLEGIFDLGLGVNMGGWVVTVAAMLVFSKTLRSRAMLAGASVATLLTYVGFAQWTSNQLIFAWFFSIAVALATGGAE